MPESPKIDFYIDSSGLDNWSNTTGKIYVFAVILVCHEMDNWKEWQEIHQTKLKGNAHFGERWPIGEKTPIIHHLFTKPPWLSAGVMIVRPEQYLKNLRKYAQIGEQRIPDDIASTCIWTDAPFIMIRSLQKLRHQSIGNIIFNHPGQGIRARCAIASKCMIETGKPPQFVSSGNPGIDAVDGLAWAIHRFLKTDDINLIPYPTNSDFLQKSGIAIAHFEGLEPKWFTSIEDYKNLTLE